MIFKSLLIALIVGTWNGNWFPSGRAEHRASPEKELATIKKAALMISSALDKLDPEKTNDIVICLNEMRSHEVVTNLLSHIGRPALRLDIISRYRRRDRFDQQQDAIITTMPVSAHGWSTFKRGRTIYDTPPRGYVFSDVIYNCGANTTRVYAVHLKSEYGATTERKRSLNRRKRASSIEQIVKMERPPARKKNVVPSNVIIAGDINADKWNDYFSRDTVFTILEETGFVNHLEQLPLSERDTKPSKKWGRSALDYIFSRGLGEAKNIYIEPSNGASDHNAVFVLF